MDTGVKKSGGEGGIRTLDTGFGPYNGLANESFSPPSLVFNHLQSCRRSSVGLACSRSAVIVLRFVLTLTMIFCQAPLGLPASTQFVTRRVRGRARLMSVMEIFRQLSPDYGL
jgi:hypothetical protein